MSLGAFFARAENRNAPLLARSLCRFIFFLSSRRRRTERERRPSARLYVVCDCRLFALDFRFVLVPKRGHVMHDSHLRPREEVPNSLREL
jgi:hypothetical protein